MDDVFDFTTLTAEDVEGGPESGGGKKRKYETHAPFDGWYDSLVGTDKGKSVPMPAKLVKDALTILRQVADDRDMGVKIRLYAKGARVNQADLGELNPQVKVTVQFWPAPKKRYAPRQSGAVEVVEESAE